MTKTVLNKIIAIGLALIIALAVFIPIVTALSNRTDSDEAQLSTTKITETPSVNSKQLKLIEDAKSVCAKRGLKIHFPEDNSEWEFKKLDREETYFASTMVGIDDVIQEYELCCIFSSGDQPEGHYIYVGGQVFENDYQFVNELKAEGLPGN